MRYMLLIYLDEEANAARSESEIKKGMDAHTPYIDTLRRNRKYAASAALGPARDARVLRGAGGKAVATEGPFAESREQLGGFYVIDAEHLDEAIAIASECPALRTVATAIEIRPVATPAAAGEARPQAEPFFVAIHRDESRDDLTLDALRARAHLLAPSGSATCLRLRDGKIALDDGPFAEGREQIGAYCVAWAEDADEALGLASELARSAKCSVEVRRIRSLGA
jgi:hypothetical protein